MKSSVLFFVFLSIKLVQTVRLKPDQIVPGRVLKHSSVTQETRIQCLTCSIEFLYSKFDENDLCYNPSQNMSLAKEYLMNLCPPNALSCIAEVIRIHRVIAGINRKCGFSFCSEYCVQRGFGVEQETCTFCCEGIQGDSESYNCPKLSPPKA